jgi:hypothetical protein
MIVLTKPFTTQYLDITHHQLTLVHYSWLYYNPNPLTNIRLQWDEIIGWQNKTTPLPHPTNAHSTYKEYNTYPTNDYVPMWIFQIHLGFHGSLPHTSCISRSNLKQFNHYVRLSIKGTSNSFPRLVTLCWLVDDQLVVHDLAHCFLQKNC